MSHVALQTFLSPLTEPLARDGVSEISINRPGEMWVERLGKTTRCAKPELDVDHLRMLADLIAESSEQELSPEKPLLSATLPEGYRVQIVLPPAAETICITIRKPTALELSLTDLDGQGAFLGARTAPAVDNENAKLAQLLAEQKIQEFIRRAVLARKNILISGGTSTGKTTFLNACLREIPDHERLVTVEDAREVRLRQPNRVHLIASRGFQGRAQVTPQQLVETCLRLRPDRIIMGELRGAEAFAFLRAVNTGHPGSIATLHADSPAMAFEQLTLMVLQGNSGMTAPQIREYVQRVISIVIQLKRSDQGRGVVQEIAFSGSDL